MFYERHKHPWHAETISAWIALSGSPPLQACTIQNMSEGGARIFTANADVWPDRLDLCFSKVTSDRRWCDVVWRRGGQLGLRFSSP